MYLKVRLTTTPQGQITTPSLGFQPLISGGGGSTPSYRVDYNKTEREKILETPLTFEITSAGNIVWLTNDTTYTITLEYSKDNGQNWTQITSNTGSSAPSISVSAGDTVQLRCGTDDGYDTMASGDLYKRNMFSTTAGFKAKGNIMSLLNKDNFASLDTLQSTYTFCYLFDGCTGLTDTSKLVLPANTLAEYCYSYMFNGCTSLTTAPELPATTLANYCYAEMFNGCSSLTTAPELPATTLAEGCYSDMFIGCTSLTTAPELPATTLAGSCYGAMFNGCTSLTTAPELPATTLAEGCYGGMFNGCSSLTTAPELPATTLASSCYYNMFQNCTSLTKAPDLPATTLGNSCYNNMFKNCTSLTTAPELPATTLAYDCYDYMFQGCSSLNYIKAMFTTTPGSSYTRNWVSGVASTGTFVKNSAATWNVTGTSGIPTGWNIQTATS